MFDKYSSYFDILNQEKDYILESKYLKKILEKFQALEEFVQRNFSQGKHQAIRPGEC